MISFREETEEDYEIVYNVVREAFWNHFQPGADEHYLLHLLRASAEYVPQLSLVACQGDSVVGKIAYTEAKIVNEKDEIHRVLSFGPVAVAKELQRTGIGSQLINHTIERAKSLGYKAVIIYGDPRYYRRFGFRCGERFEIQTSEGKYQTCLLVLPLEDQQGFLNFRYSGRFYESSCFQNVTAEDVEEFDKRFPAMEKLEDTPSQRDFKVLVGLSY